MFRFRIEHSEDHENWSEYTTEEGRPTANCHWRALMTAFFPRSFIKEENWKFLSGLNNTNTEKFYRHGNEITIWRVTKLDSV